MPLGRSGRSIRWDLDAFCVAPQPLEIVEVARLRQKHVDDEVPVVHEYPFGVVVAFEADRQFAEIFHLQMHFVADRLILASVGTAADYEVVGEACHLTQVEDYNVLGFLGFRRAHGDEPVGSALFWCNLIFCLDLLSFANGICPLETLCTTIDVVRFLTICLMILALGMSPRAQSSESPALERAQQELNRIRGLVEAGAMPRATLEAAEREVAEARDEVVLSESLYGKASVSDLTDDQAGAMLRAAERQVTRQQEKVDAEKELVDHGVKPRTALTPLIEELDRRQKTLDLAKSRVRLLEELAKIVDAERRAEELGLPEGTSTDNGRLIERYGGSGVFTTTDFRQVQAAFEKRFGRALPISALGMTELHRRLGFDHSGRVDVALDPDDQEGRWLRQYLEGSRIPYYAIRGAVPGKATGAHIHMGPPSLRMRMVAARKAAPITRAKLRKVRAKKPRSTTADTMSAD